MLQLLHKLRVKRVDLNPSSKTVGKSLWRILVEDHILNAVDGEMTRGATLTALCNEALQRSSTTTRGEAVLVPRSCN